MFGNKKWILCVGILVIVALLFCSCSAKPKPAPDEVPPDTAQGLQFNFTRADELDIDEDRNRAVYLLDAETSDQLNALLASEAWVEATDVPGMGMESLYMLYDDAGQYVIVDPWDDDRCLVRVRDIESNRLDLYYAPPEISADFHAFMETLTPLLGKLTDSVEWYFNMLTDDPGFKVLLQPLTEDSAPVEGFSDGQLAAYAIHRLDNYSYEDGNTAEEYHTITEKYFGRKIANFDNGMTETIPETDRIRATGWSFNNGVYMVLYSEITDGAGDVFIGDFYAYDISDSFFEEHPEALPHIAEYLMTGNDEEYPTPIRVRVELLLALEMRGEVQYTYPVYKSVTVLP